MAIIKKAALGITTGKIGNLILRDLNGQNIVQQRNYHYNIKGSELQNRQRMKVRNVMNLYHFINKFIDNWGKDRLMKQSIYNVFVSCYTVQMNDLAIDSTQNLFDRMILFSQSRGNYMNDFQIAYLNNNLYRITLNNQFYPIYQNMFVKCAWYSDEFKTFQIREFPIYQEDIIKGYVEFSFIGIGTYTMLAYIFIKNLWYSSFIKGTYVDA